MQETIGVRGDVVIKIYRGKELIDRVEYRNLVVTNGKQLLAKLLGGDAAFATEMIGQIAFGTDDGTLLPLAVSNTAIGAQVLAKAVTVTYPAANQVTFAATMLDSEGGTNTFNEIGLLSADTDILFSRLLIGAIEKSTAYKIDVEWTISFQ